MTRQYCEAYRGWHIWFETDGGYVIWDDKNNPHLAEGYYDSREDARKDIDWHVSKPRGDVPPDSPSIDPPWWHHR
jgi:hypothetical protein